MFTNFYFVLQIIGSSLLLMHDKQNKAGIWMIDFAKTLRVEGRNLTHRMPWVVGNHEDGYLNGVDHLTKVSAIDNCEKSQPKT